MTMIPSSNITAQALQDLRSASRLAQTYQQMLASDQAAPNFPRQPDKVVYAVQNQKLEASGSDTPESVSLWNSEHGLCAVTASPQAAVYEAVRHLLLPLMAAECAAQAKVHVVDLDDSVLVIRTSSHGHPVHLINEAEDQIIIRIQELK